MKTEVPIADAFPLLGDRVRALSPPAQYDLFRAISRARREIGGAELAQLLRYLAEREKREETP